MHFHIIYSIYRHVILNPDSCPPGVEGSAEDDDDEKRIAIII